jgi:tetratricopeptide (TPR) repeat protein
MRPVSIRFAWILAVSLSVLFPALGQDRSVENLIAQGRELESAGQFAKAEALFGEAYKRVQKAPSQAMVTVVILDCLASTAADQGRYADAERFLSQALAIAERTAGPNSNPTGKILWHLASIYADCGRLDSAGPLLKRYESIVMQEAANDPGTAAMELGNLGRVYLLKLDAKRALALFEQAVGLAEKQASKPDFGIARALLDRARAFAATHALDRAFADVDRARALIAQMPDASAALRIELAVTAGTVSAAANQPSETEAAFQQAIRLTETFYGSTHPLLALILTDGAVKLRSLHKKKEASAYDARAKLIAGTNGDAKVLGRTVSIYTLR